jgi:hypothetical protein
MKHIWILGALFLSLSSLATPSSTFEQLVAESKMAPVPQRVQIEGTCGLFGGMNAHYAVIRACIFPLS